MTKQAAQLVVATDWGELLLEIQTTPDSGLTDSHGQLYAGVYGSLHVCAQRWLSNRRLSESRDNELVAIGLDKIFRDIAKFKIPNDDPEVIRRKFIAWALKCSEREWGKQKGLMRPQLCEFAIVENDEEFSPPNPESIWIELEDSPKLPLRPVTERALMKRILAEELNRLAPAMKLAVLETTDIKCVKKPKARGESGTAEEIASKHGYNAGAVRTARSRLSQRVKERFQQEAKS